MSKFTVLVLLAVFSYAAAVKVTCDGPSENIESSWVSMKDNCLNHTRKQIQMEVDASFTYLNLAAHFSRDTVNMPGFAKLFFEHATEERSHALGLLNYLLMRGPVDKHLHQVGNILKTPIVNEPFVGTGLDALRAALAKEQEVTESIRKLIGHCDGDQDYHLSDHLTGEFLEEQYRGMRDLAGKISTLSKMMDKSGRIGLFLFDKQLLA